MAVMTEKEASGTVFAEPPLAQALIPDQLGQALRRQLPLLALGALLGLLSGLYYIRELATTYTAASTLLIDQRRVRAVQDAYPFSPAGTEGYDINIASQIETIRSEKMARLVLARLGDTILASEHNSHANNIDSDRPLVRRWLTSVTHLMRNMLGQPADPIVPPEQHQLDFLRNHLTVKRVGRTQLIEIGFATVDPAKSAAIANAFTDAYLAEQTEQQKEATARATVWLRSQVDELKLAVEKADFAIQKYKTDMNLVSTGGRLIDDQKLAEISNQLSLATAEKQRIETRYQKLKSLVDIDNLDAALTETLSNSAVEQARARYLASQKGEREAVQRLGAEHASAIRLRNEARLNKEAVAKELNRVTAASLHELEIAKAREKEITGQYLAMISTNTSTNEKLIELRELERRSDALKATHTAALQKYQESILQHSTPVTDLRVISLAMPPLVPQPMHRAWILAMAMGLGSLAGAAIGAARELRDNSVRTKRQAQDLFAIEATHLLPLVADHRSSHEASGLMKYVVGEPRSHLSEVLQAAKISIDALLPGSGPRVIAFSSIVPDEGVTTVAMNMASLIAKMGSKTLLIDCNLRNPDLSKHAETRSTGGLIEAISTGKLERPPVSHDPITNLDLLPIGSDSTWQYSAGVFTGPGMKNLLQAARSNYDYVLLDLPSIATSSDAAAVAPLVDGFAIVTEWGKTRRRTISDVLTDNNAIQQKLLVALLNKTDWKRLPSYMDLELR